MNRRNLLGTLGGALLGTPPVLRAQQEVARIGSVPARPWLSSKRREFTAPELPDAPDEWIARSFAWVDDMLQRHPPSLPEHPVRRAALIRLDDILHIDSAPRKPIVQEYLQRRMARVIEEIEQTKVASGGVIWKLYNHGFLVRTPSVSWTYDLVPGAPRIEGFRIAPELLKRLVTQSDATFISHLHGDHASEEVARLFLEQGKPVVAPDKLWAEQADLASRLTYPVRSTTAITKLPVRRNQQTLEVVAYPGHQGETVLNNVHLVRSPEGFTTVQTGDQWFPSDFEWLAHVGSQHRVDVLLPNCWTMEIQRMVRGINPRFIMTGHENEMAHTVPHREDYTQTWNHLEGSGYPLLLLAWGESFRFAAPPAAASPKV
ncbi:MAG: hypothetical protein H7039_12315 [Bryobacteraceae bacterium]|nr:hypothetical protein [Bryobacteraceae bacterium]